MGLMDFLGNPTAEKRVLGCLGSASLDPISKQKSSSFFRWSTSHDLLYITLWYINIDPGSCRAWKTNVSTNKIAHFQGRTVKNYQSLPSGKRLHNYGYKSPLFIGFQASFRWISQASTDLGPDLCNGSLGIHRSREAVFGFEATVCLGGRNGGY